MIKARDAIAVARSLIGTPYSQLDCINLIKKVIRTAPGGVKNYQTAGTNTLWDSISATKKYRDITWRQEGLAGAKAGHLAFKRYGDSNEDHVGIVTGDGTVVHSSSVHGEVVETPLSAKEGWDLLAAHRYIEIGDETHEEVLKGDDMTGYKAVVSLNDKENGELNLRMKPSTSSKVLELLRDGDECEVLDQTNSKWIHVKTCTGTVGYISKKYAVICESEFEKIPEEEITENSITIIDSAGNRFCPVGDFRVLIGSID